MNNLIAFPTRRDTTTASYILSLSGRWQRRRAVAPPPAVRLGDMLHELAGKRPAVLCVLEKVVAEILEDLGGAR
jgi:hypothetical protein